MSNITEIKKLKELSQNFNLLLVDDEINALKMVESILTNLFKSVTIAINGQDALEKYNKDNYDLVITDLNMPIMNGFGLIDEIRKINITQRIIILSANSDMLSLIDAIKYGVDGYIFKPIEMKQMFSSVTKAVDLLIIEKENNDYRHKLEEKVELEILKRQEKEKMLLQQARLASMGEMMDAVAHQWKQPISTIGMQVEMLEYDFEDDLIDEDYIQKFIKKINFQIKHMTNTLGEFRSFFRPSKDTHDFDIALMIDKVLLLVKDEFMKNSIQITVNRTNNFTINGIENEFKHLIINIINNSKDAFIENDLKSRNITINLLSDENNKIIEIIDNAGGIPTKIIGDIFKANITTKTDGKGTGIGLYMSSQIAQKHNGTLSVENTDDGAKFIFKQKIIKG